MQLEYYLEADASPLRTAPEAMSVFFRLGILKVHHNTSPSEIDLSFDHSVLSPIVEAVSSGIFFLHSIVVHESSPSFQRKPLTD